MVCKGCCLEGFKGKAEMINAGFSALNLVNFILKTKLDFNRLGRYYQEFKIMIDLYKMYLSDLTLFYDFLKLLIDELLSHP